MKMCILVVYPGPLSFARVMSVWTWKFDTIHRALCHHNSSHMLNEMFVKLSILQDPNMKMYTLVAYIPVHWIFLELCPKLCTCTSLYVVRSTFADVERVGGSIEFSQNYESKSCVLNMFWLNYDDGDVPRSGQLSYSINLCIKAGLLRPAVPLVNISTMHCQLCIKVGILFAYWRYLHDRLISPCGEGWVHKTILNVPRFYWSAWTKPITWGIIYL